MPLVGSYHSRMIDGKLTQVGALVLDEAKNKLTYAALDQYATQEPPMVDAIARGRANGKTAADSFDYFLSSANGITNDWSRRATLRGDDVAVALARLLATLRAAQG